MLEVQGTDEALKSQCNGAVSGCTRWLRIVAMQSTTRTLACSCNRFLDAGYSKKRRDLYSGRKDIGYPIGPTVWYWYGTGGQYLLTGMIWYGISHTIPD